MLQQVSPPPEKRAFTQVGCRKHNSISHVYARRILASIWHKFGKGCL